MLKRFELTYSNPEINQAFKFGLLLNSPIVETWQAETIQLLLKEGHQLEVVVLNIEVQVKKTFFQFIKDYPYDRFIFRIWNRFIFRPKSKKLVDISHIIENAATLKVMPLKKSVASYFNERDVDDVKSYKLDFLLRFGFNILRGDILNAAKFGVWSFHHDDEQEYRGSPPGFWEFIHNKPQNGIILQRLTEELDKGYILKKIWLPVINHSYKSHLDQLYFESCMMPSLICRQLNQPDFQALVSTSKARIYTPPGNLKMFGFLFLSLYRRLAFHLNFLFIQEDWHIAFLESNKSFFQSNEQKLNWLERKEKAAYLADPFVFDYKAETYLFTEHFDYQIGKGSLVAFKSSEGFKKPHSLLNEEKHFSFPFVLKQNGEIYCIPECYESNAIKLYRFDSADMKLVFVKNILDGYQAIDPVIFSFEDKWWLFFTTKSMPSVHLYAFYSNEPFGNYLPHNNNPIKTDIRSARNAGTPYFENGKLFRPSQDCSSHYGRAVNVCEITSLSPTTFMDKVVDRIEPVINGKYPKGLHTINRTSSITVIDGKRFTFSIYGLRHQLLQKLKRR